MKVVVVDDSAVERNFFRMLLSEAYGYAYYADSNLNEGFERHSLVANGATRRQGKSAVAFAEPGLFGEACFGTAVNEVTIHQAATGQEGLELCQTLSPDCILLDDVLPDMSGMEFLARLNAQTQQTGASMHVPAYAVVMVTGILNEKGATEALKNGAQDYLVRGRITAESLSLALDKAIGKVSLIRALKAERDRLADSLAEKEVLLKEVHHRVKNNLQVIVSLLRMQSSKIPDARLSNALQESQRRVESMAFIHEQLYETSDLREVDLSLSASLLAAKLFNSYGVDATWIQCRMNMPALPLAVDQAIPAVLILNELISNTLKHAFPGNRRGVVELRGGRCGDQVFLEVEDDGVGMASDIDVTQPYSLGLEIVQILAKQLKGTATLAKRHGCYGTTIRIEFPIPDAFVS